MNIELEVAAVHWWETNDDNTLRLVFFFLSMWMMLIPFTHSILSEGLSGNWETWKLKLPKLRSSHIFMPHPAIHLALPQIFMCYCRHITMWVRLCVNMFLKFLKYELFYHNHIHPFFTELQICLRKCYFIVTWYLPKIKHERHRWYSAFSETISVNCLILLW